MPPSPDLVIPRIFAAIDDHRFDDLPAFYTADVQADTAVGHVSGREQLVATLRAIHEPVAVLQHLVTGVIVDPHGDDADVRANVVATFCDEEHRPTLEGASVWRGRLRHSGNDWRVSEFSLNLVWSRGSIPPTWEFTLTADPGCRGSQSLTGASRPFGLPLAVSLPATLFYG